MSGKEHQQMTSQHKMTKFEIIINPEQQLAISGRRRTQLAPAEVLYSYNRQTARHRVYEHYSEQRINCEEGDQIDLRLCNDQSYQALRREGLQHIHIGLAMIRLHTLHKIGAGTNPLIVLQDTRWSNTTRIISTIEGVNTNPRLQSLARRRKQSPSNTFIDRKTFKYELCVENVVDHLSTRGISAIPGERRTMEELEGQSWHLRPVENVTARLPTGVAVHQRINRSTSLRFERYRNQTPARASVDQRDQEVMGDEEEILTAAVASVEGKIPHKKMKDCLLEEEDLKYEPLNVQKRSNKPRNKKKQKWSTLGEPSGKWDYYV
ncbi:hypothetical protein Tco_1487805, partial [Tanacetum coccineum]